MTNPWNSLDAATGQKKLYLEPTLSSEVETAFTPYRHSLQTLINDALDDTTGYFGEDPKNKLAGLMQDAFNARGKALTDYLKAQLSQAEGLVKTAKDAAAAMQAAEND